MNEELRASGAFSFFSRNHLDVRISVPEIYGFWNPCEVSQVWIHLDLPFHRIHGFIDLYRVHIWRENFDLHTLRMSIAQMDRPRGGTHQRFSQAMGEVCFECAVQMHTMCRWIFSIYETPKNSHLRSYHSWIYIAQVHGLDFSFTEKLLHPHTKANAHYILHEIIIINTYQIKYYPSSLSSHLGVCYMNLVSSLRYILS